MELRLLYFGIVRERLRRREESRDLPAGATVGDLLDDLSKTDGIFSIGAGSIRVAVNREYVEKSHVLADGDEVAIIPPVAGGSLATVCGGSSQTVAGRSSQKGAALHEPGHCSPFPAARGQ